MPEAEQVDAVFGRQRLQFAVVVASAGVALAVMAGQQEVEDVAASPSHLGGMGADADGGCDGIAASGLKRALPFDLDDANSAHARQA